MDAVPLPDETLPTDSEGLPDLLGPPDQAPDVVGPPDLLSPDVCSPMPEVCNGLDDNCDGQPDEGALCPGEQCCGSAGCVPLNSLKYCGSCGNACDTKVADSCVGGDCRCGGAQACIASSNPCYESQCDKGTCVLVLLSGAGCPGGVCDKGGKCCTTCIMGSGACATTTSNSACGSGGVGCDSCGTGQSCQNGSCI